MSIDRTDHLGWEILHARKVGHRPGEPPPLEPGDPVPWCECAPCELRRLDLEPAVVDLLEHQLLPDLAAKIPAERSAVATRMRRQWAEAAMVVLPPVDVLVDLAGRLPGARKSPRPVRDDRDDLPVEAARRVDIRAVCERLAIDLKRTGRSWRGDCPFHESESGTSFTVSPRKGVFHCFGCGSGGDGIDLFRRVEGVDFPVAVKTLANLSPTRGALVDNPGQDHPARRAQAMETV